MGCLLILLCQGFVFAADKCEPDDVLADEVKSLAVEAIQHGHVSVAASMEEIADRLQCIQPEDRLESDIFSKSTFCYDVWCEQKSSACWAWRGDDYWAKCCAASGHTYCASGR